MDQTQAFNMEKLKSFDVPAKYEKQLLKAFERAKEYAGIEDWPIVVFVFDILLKG